MTSTMMTSMHTLKTHLASVESEVLALNSGLKSAGPRARKALQSLKDSAHSMRAEIIVFQKDLPVKKRVSKNTELAETEEPLPEPPVLERQAADPVDVMTLRTGADPAPSGELLRVRPIARKSKKTSMHAAK